MSVRLLAELILSSWQTEVPQFTPKWKRIEVLSSVFAKPLFWCRYSHRSCQHRSPQIYGEISCADILKKGAAYVSNQRIYWFPTSRVGLCFLSRTARPFPWERAPCLHEAFRGSSGMLFFLLWVWKRLCLLRRGDTSNRQVGLPTCHWQLHRERSHKCCKHIVS